MPLNRYTKYNKQLGRYTVPCLYKENGEQIQINVYQEPDEYAETARGLKICTSQGVTHLFGEFIDRLAELEDKEEADAIFPEVHSVSDVLYVDGSTTSRSATAETRLAESIGRSLLKQGFIEIETQGPVKLAHGLYRTSYKSRVQVLRPADLKEDTET